jgi:hypothetical protein
MPRRNAPATAHYYQFEAKRDRDFVIIRAKDVPPGVPAPSFHFYTGAPVPSFHFYKSELEAALKLFEADEEFTPLG